MAREDEIRSVASDHRDWVCCGFIDPIADVREESFAEGAEWADKTMIEKACKWLSDNKNNYIIDIEGETLIDDQIITDFRKAMEE